MGSDRPLVKETMPNETEDTTDVQEQQVAFMTALAAREVNAASIRGDGQKVFAELLDGKADVEQADRIAGEFGYERVYGAHYQEDGEDRMTVSFDRTGYDGVDAEGDQ